jgi:hypothetical protein
MATTAKAQPNGLATLDAAGKLPAAQSSASPSFSGDITTAGNLILSTAAKGIKIKEGGAAARMGTGTLNGSTEVTIATTAVTATSRIFLTISLPHGTPTGQIYVSSRSVGVSFGVKGVGASDTSDFAWMIVEPSP